MPAAAKHKKVNVILVRSYLQKLQLVPFRNFQTHLFQNFIHPLVEYGPPVLRRED
ncbi:hypothetical protein R69658_06820 [Paraburkholderia aspalathi]|uniref:Uncharacterized protein n=1 Tax=Paraburkholderia aspalathi TaxID=1324617 RepID=A0ABM8SYW8_9BURK|nr:hypothetical protein R69658_06820 [Paraburkholderia aspalathi]